MAAIRLADAAKHYKEQPHQLAAWNRLQEQLTPEQLVEFSELYRAAPLPKPLDTPNTWAGVQDAAKRAGAKYPELVAAQWALESAHGKHTSGRHNYFGLKGPGTKRKTQEVINGKTVTIVDEFIDFRDLDDCVTYLVDRWHRNWRDFKGVNNAANRDEAARALVTQGYATDPDYAAKLIRLMNEKTPLKPPAPSTGPLKVPYYSQRDSALSGQAQRMCFSSSCAMLTAYLRPGSITGPNADDQYLKRVQQYGDTTDANAQLKALASFGITARFVQNADWADLERQVSRGVPVPCGFLHHGTSSAPSGGGHWLTVIGFTPTAAIVNDPWGEMLVAQGTYTSSRGAGLAYSRKNWAPRWCVEGPRSGWAIIAEP